MARLDLIHDAVRPKMNGRALFQGPQGSGKTWTMLSVARHLAGPAGTVLMIDTERESALTYADVFAFRHLPWRPPYDPAELTATLDKLANNGCPDVLCIDSLSHFWQGTGGILDIASGRVQGGWDRARPIQNALVEQLLAMPCHVLLGARMKNSVLVSDNGKTIENVGLTIIQDDTLGYELNVVVQLDMAHTATVMKSRSPAVPVGRAYPGGYERKLAEDYDEWLAGGTPPANRDDVDRVVQAFANIGDKDVRRLLKDAFVAEFGMPHSLTADAVSAATAWMAEQGHPVGGTPEPVVTADGPQAADGTDTAPKAGRPPSGTTAAPDGTPARPRRQPPAEAVPDVPAPAPETLPDLVPAEQPAPV